MKLRGRFLRTSMAILLAIALIFGIAPANTLAAEVGGNQEKVKVIIGFNEKPGKAEEALIHNFGGSVKHTFNIIPSIAAELPLQAVEALSNNPRVKIVEADVKAYTIGTFTEELNKTWGMVRIGESTVHDQNYLGTGVKVAIVDCGIDYTHPELAAIYKGGYDFVNMDNDPMDIDGHGTHVAGTVAATLDGNGVVGAAPGVELYAVKVLEGGSGDFSDIIAALEWCVNNGIQVTNNSYGSSTDPGTQVRDAFDKSYASGILHIASAGNEGTITGKNDTVGFPAKYSSVMAVAASDELDQRASFSSTGAKVEIIAPGVNIYSTFLNNAYATASGTSMASPHVAGVAAQVLAANPSLGNTGVRDILKNTAENLGLPAIQQGYGLVRADLAISAATGSVLPKPSYELIIAQVGSGTTTPAAGTYTHEEGTVVNLSAVPDTGYKFDKWVINGVDVTSSQTTITMDASKTATAYFSPVTVSTLNLNVSTNKTDYTGNTKVYITVSLTNQNIPVAGSAVNVTITPLSGGKVTNLTGTTDAKGQLQLNYHLLKNSIKGTYEVKAYLPGNTSGVSAVTYFNVY